VTVAERAPGLRALDRLSDELVAGAKTGGVRVAIVQAQTDCDAIHRLRHQQVVRDGWVQPDDLPPGIERDEYDAAALQVGAWIGETLAGAMRLVLPSPNRRLPVEDAFELEMEPRGAVIEAGRLVIAPQYRGDPSHRIWGALFARAWLTLRSRGFSLLCGAASPEMVKRLRALGLPFEVIGPARQYWGEWRVPVRLDPAGSDPRWFDRLGRDGNRPVVGSVT
jgi:N-acyl-L-homoserine lactone synthetase